MHFGQSRVLTVDAGCGLATRGKLQRLLHRANRRLLLSRAGLTVSLHSGKRRLRVLVVGEDGAAEWRHEVLERVGGGGGGVAVARRRRQPSCRDVHGAKLCTSAADSRKRGRYGGVRAEKREAARTKGQDWSATASYRKQLAARLGTKNASESDATRY